MSFHKSKFVMDEGESQTKVYGLLNKTASYPYQVQKVWNDIEENEKEIEEEKKKKEEEAEVERIKNKKRIYKKKNESKV